MAKWWEEITPLTMQFERSASQCSIAVEKMVSEYGEKGIGTRLKDARGGANDVVGGMGKGMKGTTTAQVSNAISVESANEQAGGNKDAMGTWVTTGGGDVCQGCALLHGTVMSLREFELTQGTNECGFRCYCFWLLGKPDVKEAQVRMNDIEKKHPEWFKMGKKLTIADWTKTISGKIKTLNAQNINSPTPKPVTKEDLIKQIQSGMKGSVEYALPANAARFRESYVLENTPDGKLIKNYRYGKVVVSTLSTKQVKRLSGLFKEANILCDKMGIPRLRGLSEVLPAAVGGTMGDGVLSFNKESWSAISMPVDSPPYQKYLKQWRVQTIEKLKMGLRLHDASCYFYDNPDLIADATFWHEFGHHIHQQFGVKNRADYFKPPLEKSLPRVLSGMTRNNIHGRHPTHYSKESSLEWFAENYALLKMKRGDLVVQEFKDYITKKGIEL